MFRQLLVDGAPALARSKRDNAVFELDTSEEAQVEGDAVGVDIGASGCRLLASAPNGELDIVIEHKGLE